MESLLFKVQGKGHASLTITFSSSPYHVALADVVCFQPMAVGGMPLEMPNRKSDDVPLTDSTTEKGSDLTATTCTPTTINQAAKRHSVQPSWN